MLRRFPVALWLLGSAAFASDTNQSVGDEEYSEAEAVHFFRYTQAGFCTAARLKAWDCGDICRAAPIKSGTSRVLGARSFLQLQGYVAELPSELLRVGDVADSSAGAVCVVNFRGSVDALNWLADFEAWQAPWPPSGFQHACDGCKVHHGFSEAYMELRTELLSAVEELGCQRITIGGHSLGAGLAALAAMDLRAEVGLHVERVYLYGCPRVGNPEFAAHFVAAGEAQQVRPAAWRIVHFRDPVPRLQLRRLGYEHFPREVYYTKEDSSAFKVCDRSSGEDPSCADSLPLLFMDPRDHTTYLNLTCEDKRLPADCTSEQADIFV